MIDSGERMDFAGWPVTADKHSTGGVGDKILLLLHPWFAVLALPFRSFQAEALATGGTWTKLEAIPGWRASLSNEVYHQLGEGCGAATRSRCGLRPQIKLYALRDILDRRLHSTDCLFDHRRLLTPIRWSWTSGWQRRVVP